MKVAVLSEVKKLTIKEKPKPEIGSEEILVKIKACGICGSDLHSFQSGLIFPVGTVMGHECTGVIVEKGENLTNFTIGDRVAVHPAPPCRACDACKRGRETVCLNWQERSIGHNTRLDGGFAEYLRVPWPNEMLYHLPDTISYNAGALVDPFATALHGIRRSTFKLGDRVVVIGAGPIGLCTVQLLKLGGAGKIIVLEISPERSKLVRKLGADVVLNPNEEGDKISDRIFAMTHGLGVDIVYECAGILAALKNALGLAKGGGEVIVIGISEQETPISSMTLVFKEIQIKGCLGYTTAEFSTIIDLMSRKKLNTGLMISDAIALNDIEAKGFKRLISFTDVVKIIVRP